MLTLNPNPNRNRNRLPTAPLATITIIAIVASISNNPFMCPIGPIAIFQLTLTIAMQPKKLGRHNIKFSAAIGKTPLPRDNK